MNSTKYWIASISKEHTQRGVDGGFIQVCHGKQAPLKRMRKGDYLLVYSAKLSTEGNAKRQSFTAIGEIIDDVVFQYQMTENFKPFRRKIAFLQCKEIPIIPLINELEFITNKKLWGYPFRYGFFEINENDFNLNNSQILNFPIFVNYSG